MSEQQSLGTAARVAVESLTPFGGNPRRGNVDVIAESLAKSGQYRPIVVNKGSKTGRENEVLAGNHTLAAAKKLGWDEIDVWLVDVDETAAKRIVAADNRTADLGDYDNEALAALLSEIEDLEGTGYTDADLELLMGSREDPDAPEDFPTFDDDIETEYRCPKCSYEWSGKPN